MHHRHAPAALPLIASALASVLVVTAAQSQTSSQSPAPAATKPAATKPAATTPAAPTPSTQAGKFREIKWDDLMPPDWDPMKGLKNANFGMFSDADPRAAAALKEMRTAWDNAPVNNKMDGATVRIPGYVVPLEENKSGLKEFLLVPYFGACIHSPPPPANQIIHITRQTPVKFHSMDPVWVSGTLKTLRSDTFMGATGYRMEAVVVEAYTDTPGGDKTK
jgi:uncharacterized protein